MVGIMLLLRSRVPLPPGPFLPVVQLRYYFERVFGYCRTYPAAIATIQRQAPLTTQTHIATVKTRREKKK
jgi:hypothetical protein